MTGLVLGFIEAGSPGRQRLANADIARSRDLDQIVNAVKRHNTIYRRLPDKLPELTANNASLRLHDPETNQLYEYRRLDEQHYELCAVFATDSSAEPSPPFSTQAHHAGRQCFTY